jgi:hypothetical protein
MSCLEYFEREKNIVEVIKSIGGSLGDNMHLADELPTAPSARGYTTQQYDTAWGTIMNKKIAYGILLGQIVILQIVQSNSQVGLPL